MLDANWFIQTVEVDNRRKTSSLVSMPRLRTPMDDTLAASTAREIRAEMSRQGVTQEALAARLGCTQRLLSRRLTAEIAIDTKELDRIAAALDVPVTRFLPSEVKA